MNKILLAFGIMIALFSCKTDRKEHSENNEAKAEQKYQAKAPPAQPFGEEAFGASTETTVRWLGMAGFFINSGGTTFMIDPLLVEFDMPLLIDFPINTNDVPRLDAVLITHANNDRQKVKPRIFF